MVVSEAQKAQILSLSETMSTRKIAEKTGVPKSTVAYIIKHASGRPPNPGKRSVQVTEILPAPARTTGVPVRDTAQLRNCPESTETLSPYMVASVALDHLLSEMDLYKRFLEEAKHADPKDAATAEWKVISHEKLVQSHLRTLAQWFGMDKGDVLKTIEEIRHDPFREMSKEELLRLYEATE